MGDTGTAGQAASGWFEDPSGRHQLRFWDGTVWTEHVSDAGVVGMDALQVRPQPLAAVPTASRVTSAQQVFVDENVKAGLTKKRLRLDSECLEWAGERVALAAVDAVSYKVTRQSVNGIPATTIYEFLLWSAGRKTKVSLTAASVRRKEVKDEVSGLFEALVQGSAALIEGRLRQAILGRVAADETVEVAGLRLSRQGIEQPRRLRGAQTLAWDRYAGAGFQAGAVAVFGRKDDGSTGRATFLVDMAAPNAILLPELLQQCAELH